MSRSILNSTGCPVRSVTGTGGEARFSSGAVAIAPQAFPADRPILFLALSESLPEPLPELSRRETLDFELLDLLAREPELTQREMAERLGLSLGRMNYCLKALRDKGAVKLRNFRKSPNKLGYVYVLTPAGIGQRARLASAFLARKRAEFDRLKAQIDTLQKEFGPAEGEGRRT